MNQSNATAAILAILLEAKQAGIRKLTRTTLVKYLYLLDLWIAEETGGHTFTEAEWTFLHFGPYSAALADTLDNLSKTPSVDQEEISGKEKDYFLYSLGEWSKAKTLESLGFSFDVRSRFKNFFTQYAGDLQGLLDYVYFMTEPMTKAKPGEVLSFADVHRTNYKADFRPLPIPMIYDPKKATRMKELMARIGDNWKRSHQAFKLSPPPIFDKAYLSVLEDEPLGIVDGALQAELTFRDRER